MSHIITSYLRIYKKGGTLIDFQDIALFKREIIKRHDDFGSYHVPILIENNDKRRYIDIQFGSGKSDASIENFAEDFKNEYVLWHREFHDNYDFDIIEKVPKDDFEKEKPWKIECKYKFDRISFSPNLKNTKHLSNWENTDSKLEKDLKGFYFASNEEFGSNAEIDVNKKYEFRQLRGIQQWKFSNKTIREIIQKAGNNIQSEIHLSFNERLVAHFFWREKEGYFISDARIDQYEFVGKSMDDWDNCDDDNFVLFHEEFMKNEKTDNTM